MPNPPNSPGRPDRAESPTPAEIARRVEEIAARNDLLIRQMMEGEKRFRSLAKAVWKVQEEERRRLARELHDGIGQTLTALVNQLKRPRQDRGASPEEDGGDPLAIAELALRDVRELSRLLRPPVLDDLGLRAALQWLARILREHGGLTVAVDWQGGDARLDPELETLIFRIAQEALTNVARHSGQQEARLTARRKGGRFELEVADTGAGFDADAALSAGGAAGLGLRGIRDRVEMWSGRFTIESSPGRGARLSVVVPIGEEAS